MSINRLIVASSYSLMCDGEKYRTNNDTDRKAHRKSIITISRFLPLICSVLMDKITLKYYVLDYANKQSLPTSQRYLAGI